MKHLDKRYFQELHISQDSRTIPHFIFYFSCSNCLIFKEEKQLEDSCFSQRLENSCLVKVEEIPVIKSLSDVNSPFIEMPDT